MQIESITEVFSIDEMKRLWREELAEHYIDTPRLYLLLLNTPLHFTQVGNMLLISFEVYNEAQRLWVESHKIKELNNCFREITGKQNIKISVSIEDKPEDESICIIDTMPPHIPNDVIPILEITELEIEID